MAHPQEKEEPNEQKRQQYPLDSTSYKLLAKIGEGVSATVYKAICEPMNSTVAIKSINLDHSRVNLENIRRESNMMSLFSHPNILNAHCSFTVDRRLWVVMPFMSGGSLYSIISSSFPNGLPEACIAIVLKETLKALCYLHKQGQLHRDVKAGNILVDQNGYVKLADFGVLASIYDSSSSSSLMLNDVAGTPYWMAPEVIHSHVGYNFKADIWSFGITALELAHGRPPLSDLTPSKFLLMKLTKRYRFWDCEKSDSESKKKKFSKAFKDMVASCLDQESSKRPSADKLLKHSFFKNCKGIDYLVKNVLQGLPSVEERFKEMKTDQNKNGDNSDEEEDGDYEGESTSQNVKRRRISGWNFNEEVFELDPVFPTDVWEDDSDVKQVRFGGETIIQDERRTDREERSGNINEEGVTVSDINRIGVDRDVVMQGLNFLKSSLDCQREILSNAIGMLGSSGDQAMSREEQLVHMIEKLKLDLHKEKNNNFKLEMELSFLKIRISREEQLLQKIEKLNEELENVMKKNLASELELEFLKLQISGAYDTARAASTD